MSFELDWTTLKDRKSDFGVPMKKLEDRAGNHIAFIVESGVTYYTVLSPSEITEYENDFASEANKPNTYIEPYSGAMETMLRLVPRGYYLYITHSYFTLGGSFDPGDSHWSASAIDTSGPLHKIDIDFKIDGGYYIEGVYFNFVSTIAPSNTKLVSASLCPDIPEYKINLGVNKRLLRADEHFKYDAPGAPKFVKDVLNEGISIGTHILRMSLEYDPADTGVLEFGIRSYKA